MVKPVKKSKSEEKKNEVEMNTEESNNSTSEDKIELDLNEVKKNKQFNPYASTDQKKDTKKVKLTPKKKLKKQKGIENALNRIEKDQTFLEKKQKKIQTKKKWNSLY